MTSVLINITTIAGTLTAATVVLLRYLIPLYPAEGIDPHKIVLHLAVAQYSAVILVQNPIGSSKILLQNE